MGMSSASSVSLISLSAAQEIRAIQIITWLLDIREGEDATERYAHLANHRLQRAASLIDKAYS